MRVTAVAICVTLWGSVLNAAPPASPQEEGLGRRAIGKAALARTACLAVLQEIRNSPPEWHRTIGGLGKRFASAMGKHLIKAPVQFGVAALRHEELRYHPSETPGFGHAPLGIMGQVG